MTFEEMQKEYIKRDGITFTPQTKCERKVDKNGNVYGEYTIIKPAEEVYQEWLKNKDKKIETKPSLEERISELENVILTLL